MLPLLLLLLFLFLLLLLLLLFVFVVIVVVVLSWSLFFFLQKSSVSNKHTKTKVTSRLEEKELASHAMTCMDLHDVRCEWEGTLFYHRRLNMSLKSPLAALGGRGGGRSKFHRHKNIAT